MSGSGSATLDELVAELTPVLERQSLRRKPDGGTFRLSSGGESRFFFDGKLTMLSPVGGRLCGQALARLLERCRVDAVGGLAMGAAYLATSIALASADLERPIYGFTVRREKKATGREQKVDVSWHPDGAPLLGAGRRVAVVDDVVTTGRSTVEAIEAVRATGAEVVVAAAIVDRGEGGTETFANLGLPYYSLLVADENGNLSPGSHPA